MSNASNPTTAGVEGWIASSTPPVTAEPGTLKASLMDLPAIDKMTEKETAHPSQRQLDKLTKSGVSATLFSTAGANVIEDEKVESSEESKRKSLAMNLAALSRQQSADSNATHPQSVTLPPSQQKVAPPLATSVQRSISQISSVSTTEPWVPTQDWVASWKSRLPLQTIMRLLQAGQHPVYDNVCKLYESLCLQVLVPQVEKICIDKGLTDESEILRFLQHGTLVGLLPVPHPILIRKYQPNPGTALWFR